MNRNTRCTSYDRDNLFDRAASDDDAQSDKQDRKSRNAQVGANFLATVRAANNDATIKNDIVAGYDPLRYRQPSH